MPVSPIPAGYHAVTPYLIVKGAAQAIAWYTEVFGAREHMRLPAPGGKLAHAEIAIGDTRLMIADEMPGCEAHGPGTYGGSPVGLHLYVSDVDAVMRRALDSGGVRRRPVENQFYGDRSGTLQDPFGHTWHIATHVEDVPPAELQRRMAAFGGASSAPG